MILPFCTAIAMQAAVTMREWQYSKQSSDVLLANAPDDDVYYKRQIFEILRQPPAQTVTLKELAIDNIYEKEKSFCEFVRGN